MSEVIADSVEKAGRFNHNSKLVKEVRRNIVFYRRKIDASEARFI